MKPFQLLTVTLVIMLLMSCQKGVDWFDQPLTPPPPPPPPVSTDSTMQLVRMVQTEGGVDSAVSLFYYNSSGKLIRITTNGRSGGDTMNNVIIFTRDAQNRLILSEFYEDNGYQQDSVRCTIVYAGSSNNIVYAIEHTKKYFYTSWTSDSTVMQYANGMVVKKLTTHSSPIASWNTYIYDASGNIVTAIDSSLDVTSGMRSQGSIETHQYDAKKSPFNWGSDAFFTGFGGDVDMVGVNNVTGDHDANGTSTYTYTYNSKGYPVTGVYTSPIGPPTYFKYYYK